MSEKDLLLAIDQGTQSARALLFDPHGQLVAKARIPIEPYFSPQPGWAEQHPEVFWHAICQACQKLWHSPDEIQEGYALSTLRQRLAAVALTTQRASVVNLDRNGQPLRPAILWLDQRRTEGLKPIGGWWGLAFRLAGLTQTVAYLQAEAEANWIATHQPEIWRQTAKYVLLSGYLTYRLTEQWVDSTACQVGYIPFDYKRFCWCDRRDWKWLALPVDPSMLVELKPPTSQLGEITPAAAQASGIPSGLPLIAAAADKACEVIGAGCLEPHLACLSYGTTATINTTHRKYIEAIPLIPPYPSAIPDAYNLEIQIYRGFWMVSWFKQEFGQHEQSLAEQRSIKAEQLFDELVQAVPPGCQGLVLQPYWSPGLRFPGPEARGAIVGFRDAHTRAHLYRAILEGLAYALREGAERIGKRSGVAIRELRIAGGGSQSEAAMQITADIFGLPTARPHVYEASGLGAAMDAAVGVGIYPSFDTAIPEMSHLGATFEPNLKLHRQYDEIYRRIYRQIYNRLRPLYEDLRQITGETDQET